MLVYLEPIDTLFFRDSRPFEAGTDAFAESTQMPSPLAVYGAIGSYLLRRKGADINAFLDGGNDSELGQYDSTLKDTPLKITGIFLSWDGITYLPAPANLICVNDSEYNLAMPRDGADFKSDYDLRPLEIPKGKCKPVDGFLTLDDVNICRKGESVDSLKTLKPSEYSPGELRFGHRLDRAASVVEEGFLYAAMHLRFKDGIGDKNYTKLRLLVSVSGVNGLDSEDVVLLGGEGRKARLTPADDGLDFKDDEVLSKIKQSGRFFVYLLTPAVFGEGWCPSKWPGEFGDASPVAAAVRKPLYLSGWQRKGSAHGSPRPLRKAVPPGSVYFFETDNRDGGKFDRLYSEYNFNRSLSDEYPSAGFGISLIGAW